jgi:hypothetical protein
VLAGFGLAILEAYEERKALAKHRLQVLKEFEQRPKAKIAAARGQRTIHTQS